MSVLFDGKREIFVCNTPSSLSTPLGTSNSFLDKLLQNASNALASELDGKIAPNFKAIISNVNAKPYSTATQAKELLKAQLTSPVLYKQSIIRAQDEVDCFVEFGSSVLCGLNKKITQKPSIAISDLASLNQAVEFLKNH